jgi:hypothetical protein
MRVVVGAVEAGARHVAVALGMGAPVPLAEPAGHHLGVAALGATGPLPAVDRCRANLGGHAAAGYHCGTAVRTEKVLPAYLAGGVAAASAARSAR